MERVVAGDSPPTPPRNQLRLGQRSTKSIATALCDSFPLLSASFLPIDTGLDSYDQKDSATNSLGAGAGVTGITVSNAVAKLPNHKESLPHSAPTRRDESGPR
jgi:hypothetical protein